MGYEQGKGLGVKKQGIVEPIQPKMRPGRGAVGAYGAEAKGPKFGGMFLGSLTSLTHMRCHPSGKVNRLWSQKGSTSENYKPIFPLLSSKIHFISC